MLPSADNTTARVARQVPLVRALKASARSIPFKPTVVTVRVSKNTSPATLKSFLTKSCNDRLMCTLSAQDLCPSPSQRQLGQTVDNRINRIGYQRDDVKHHTDQIHAHVTCSLRHTCKRNYDKENQVNERDHKTAADDASLTTREWILVRKNIFRLHLTFIWVRHLSYRPLEDTHEPPACDR